MLTDPLQRCQPGWPGWPGWPGAPSGRTGRGCRRRHGPQAQRPGSRPHRAHHRPRHYPRLPAAPPSPELPETPEQAARAARAARAAVSAGAAVTADPAVTPVTSVTPNAWLPGAAHSALTAGAAPGADAAFAPCAPDATCAAVADQEPAGPARYLYPAVTLKRFGASRISFVLPAGGAHPLPDGLRTPPSRSAAALRTNWGRAFACSARVRHWAGSSTTPPPTKLTITRCSQTRCPRRLRTPPVPSGRTDGRWLGCPRCGG